MPAVVLFFIFKRQFTCNMYGHMRRRIVIVVSVCIAMPLWFASRHAIHVAPPPCPPADLLLSNGLQLELEKALLRRKRALAGATAGGTLNASSWRLREAAWRDAVRSQACRAARA